MIARSRIEGILLFAFIPLVLFLYLAHPLGPGWSVALGMALMFGHRFAAAPWASRRAATRCLWCGREGTMAEPLEVASGGRTWGARGCGREHRDLSARFLAFAARWRAPIAAGIFLPLALLLAGSIALAAGRPFLDHATNALVFRTVVALTVVAASLGYLLVPAPAGGVACPFPLHNLALLGIRNTLWVFRIVGAWWLAIAAGVVLGRPALFP